MKKEDRFAVGLQLSVRIGTAVRRADPHDFFS
jgi:hypothetical protein